MPSVDQILNASLQDLKKRFVDQEQSVPRGLINALASDPRQGARQLASSILRHRRESLREGWRLRGMLRFERVLWSQGINRIAGVDEAGMAPLAGPVVAAAVILPRDYRLRGLNDSKKILDADRRSWLAEQIKRDAVCWSVGRSEVEEIDRLNIYRAGLLAMQRAVEGLAVEPDYVLVDARRIPRCPCPQHGIIRGDALSMSIAAASILAKTTRDAIMIELDRLYQGYRFASHKGYPTPEHCRILKERGALPIHRRSFAPVREVLDLGLRQRHLFEG